MKTENTNDFSKCRVGDKLWTLHCLADLQAEYNCEVILTKKNVVHVRLLDGTRQQMAFSADQASGFQPLFFSRPQFIAPPEPPRLPDYKPGQWIAVWENFSIPSVRKFVRFIDNRVICYAPGTDDEVDWKNHCTLEELPEVLAKWGETK